MKISIVTATYNSAATIADTLDSVLAQTFADYELIVADGDSDDETVRIVGEYVARFDGKLRLFCEKDRGLYDAMNKGISMATGDVVGILNSDDFYSDAHVLQRVAEALSPPDVDACYADVHYVSPSAPHTPVRYYSSRNFRPWMMRFGFIPAHPSFYCRREVYRRHGLFDISYAVAADFELLLRFIYIARIRTVYLPYDFVTMRTGGASTSGWKSHRAALRDHLRALRAHGVRSSVALLLLRFVYKAGELLVFRLFGKKNMPSRNTNSRHGA